MNISSVFFIVILCVTAGLPCRGQGLSPYLVRKTGDTVRVPQSGFIDVHAHPQVFRFRNAEGKKQVVPASDVAALYMERSVSRYYYSAKNPVFSTAAISTTDGPCHHFVQELFRSNDAHLLKGVYCNESGELKLYLQAGNSELMLLRQGNFQQLLKEHFSDSTPLSGYAERKRYSAAALEKVLLRQ